MKNVLLMFIVCAFSCILPAQQKQTPGVPVVTREIRCGAFIQPESGQVQHNVLIVIEGERIREVQPNAKPPKGVQ
ncbi:MAG: hypothetical protein ACRD4F_11085, partial [Candidatus Angelobacter sp.]